MRSYNVVGYILTLIY